MLSFQEYEQISWAIKCMNGYNFDGVLYISANNILGLLQRFYGEDKNNVKTQEKE